MKRNNKIALALLLIFLAAVVSGCAKEPVQYQEAGKPTQITQGDPLNVTDEPTEVPTPTPTIVPADLYDTDDDYDPASEEDGSVYMADGVYDENGQSVYAGTTPIPIDPVDMPTPTPRPELEFNYANVVASRLGLTFDAPNDWVVTTEDNTTYTLTDPNTRDGVNAFISISVAPVSNGYKLADVKNDLKSTLSAIQMNYPTWQTANADQRTLLEGEGYYNTYRGVMYDGTIVRGLVHIAIDNSRTITVHLQSPGYFNSSYTKVYSRLRNTLKAN